MIIGLDPGLHGGWGVLLPGGSYHRHGVMPIHRGSSGRDEIDIRCLYETIEALGSPPDLVVIEKVGPVQGASLISTWTFARTFEALISMAKLTRWPHALVRPQDWKAEVLLGTDKSKAAAVHWANQRWPQLSLKAAEDGPAEALLLAEFGRRRIINGNNEGNAGGGCTPTRNPKKR